MLQSPFLDDHPNLLVSYKGPVNPGLLLQLTDELKNKLSEYPTASRKLFMVFMELAQNVIYYSVEKVCFSDKNDGVGALKVEEDQDNYIFSCGNVIHNDRLADMMSNCEHINSLDRDGLREYKRSQRNGPQKEHSKGAGIGLIHVALTSGNPIKYYSLQIDQNYSFFSISVTIKKV